MHYVALPQKLQSTRELLEKVTNKHFVKATAGWRRVVAHNRLETRVNRRQAVTLPDDDGQIADRAKFHDEVYILFSFPAIYQGDNVRVVQFLEDLDFAFQVIEQLATEFQTLHHFEGDQALVCLDPHTR